MISTGKGVEKLLGRKGRRSGKKCQQGKGGNDRKKDLNRERVGKILGRKGGGRS